MIIIKLPIEFTLLNVCLKDKMKCTICKDGYTENGLTTITLERDHTTIVFKQVPVDICDNCGEIYLNSEINHSLLKQAGHWKC